MSSKCNEKILSSSTHGKVIKCLNCDKYQVEFKNLLFTFNKDEFDFFRNYFIDFDAHFWEQKNKDMLFRRKIIVPVGHKNVSALFNKQEIWELRDLFSTEQKQYKSVQLEKITNEICSN